MSDHDPLCSIANCRPQSIIALSYPSGPMGGYCEECSRECCCDVIAKVRADERGEVSDPDMEFYEKYDVMPPQLDYYEKKPKGWKR